MSMYCYLVTLNHYSIKLYLFAPSKLNLINLFMKNVSQLQMQYFYI